MFTPAWFRLRPVLVGGLAFAAVISTPVTHAAPSNQASPTSDQGVRIDAFAFAPAEISLPVGATLTWSNAQAGVPHTSSSLDGLWDSGVLSTGDTFGFTFDQVGDFAYQCNIHPSMRGIVHVTGAPSADAVTATTSDPAEPQAAAGAASIAQSDPAPTPTAISAPTPTPVVVAPAGSPSGY